MADGDVIKAIMVCEGEMAGHLEFTRPEHLEWFSSGFYEGAGQYGAGGASIYTRDSLSDLDPKRDKKEIALIEKYLPNA